MATKNRSKKSSLSSSTFKEISASFDQLVQDADRFLKPQPEQVGAIHQLIQQTYTLSVSSDVANQKDVLPELVLDQMDEEQIWQQLELRNALMLPQFVEQAAQLMATREQDLGIELDDDEDEDEAEKLSEQESDEENEEAQHQSESEEDSEGFNEPKAKSKQTKAKLGKKSGKKSVVDDTFFKLDEMKQFLEQEDAKEMRRQKNNKNPVDDTEGIDHYAEDLGVGEQTEDEEDDDDDGNVNYADFFDMDEELEEAAKNLPKDKARDFFNESESEEEEKVNEDEDDVEQTEQPDEVASEIDEADFVAQSGVEPASDSDSDSQKDEDESQLEDKEKSKFTQQSSNELRETRLLQRIRDYEDVVLGDKPWQLRGEVQAGNRPQNSLLEEILEFDSTTRPVAAITEEQNETIEDIIKQRIRDKAWDDVERTVRPVQTAQEYRKQLVLDQEKSKQSLAQIYEQQYQQEMQKLDPNRDGDDSTTPESKEHQEIKRAMRTLFLKLDALSNFHFTPKPVAPEIKIVTNTPAVHMEEVAPVAVSDAKLLAPEEVFRGPKHTPLGKTERTRTDKNRERRKKKQKQRAINSALEQRDLQRAKEGKAPTQREANAKLLKSITKSRNVQKITSSNDQGALKSSKAFFNKLQDTTSSTASVGSKRPKKDTSKANAKKLKL
ncbi:U3 small nucleolar ribonucleoprotein protein MPP10 [Drosophila albomicans]|uniref:U3 small nucleolar ribonucleoprotein protein MPP10 n=1 Tax=Drosophila albomicans TaxID=7291 RepID=A0A6P8WQ95_DROAB|nr:U3 small nucleolar ribonucleoprotein protein MPP10 [Drosophila albomicans]